MAHRMSKYVCLMLLVAGAAAIVVVVSIAEQAAPDQIESAARLLHTAGALLARPASPLRAAFTAAGAVPMRLALALPHSYA